MKADQ